MQVQELTTHPLHISNDDGLTGAFHHNIIDPALCVAIYILGMDVNV